MKPTEILSQEHRVIEQVLDCLDVVGQKALRSGTLDAVAARDILRFLRVFADRCHHAKEEKRLFPLLQARGMPGDVGPIAVMLGEHEVGRAVLSALGSALDGHARGEAGAARRFSREALAYVELLREHIGKEDEVLFPMAEAMLRPEDREQLLGEFAEDEASEHGPGIHAAMLALASDLSRRLGVEHGVMRARRRASGCGPGARRSCI